MPHPIEEPESQSQLLAGEPAALPAPSHSEIREPAALPAPSHSEIPPEDTPQLPRSWTPSGIPWREWEVPGLGKLVYDEGAKSMGAHCKYRGHKSICRINRVTHKKPLGYLLAWLEFCPACIKNAELHKALKSGAATICTYANRVAARNRWLNEPSLAEPFALEMQDSGHVGHGPVVEPLD